MADIAFTAEQTTPHNTLVPVEPRQTFQANYAVLPALSLEIYREYQIDVMQIHQQLIKEELSYYATALLWLRLIHVKSKQQLYGLTEEEKKLHEDTENEVYNVPQPLYEYLASIGAIADKMGTLAYLNTPALPISCAGGFGGYHSEAVNARTHTLFEEVPSLGIAGDMVMAASSNDNEPNQDFRVAFPKFATFSDNLVGRYPTTGPSSITIRKKLAGFGITQSSFDEYCKNTRFHRKYIRSISNLIGKWNTFKIERMCFRNSTSDGGMVQAITSKPNHGRPAKNWISGTVQSYAPENSATAMFGAATVFLFQLHKEPTPGDDETQRNANWCCARRAGSEPWVIPPEWIRNRNERRDLPKFLRAQHFGSIPLRADIILQDTVRRMVRTRR